MLLKVFEAQPIRRKRVIDCITSPFLFARRVVDVRGEDIGQHLFPN
jgi:hypothetical protein